MDKLFRILSIDAWADGEDSWTWNTWHKVGEATQETADLSEPDLIAWFVSEGYANERALTECYIDDDQYNLVLCVRETNEPLFALEYGSHE